jgi:hypothetical protein
MHRAQVTLLGAVLALTPACAAAEFSGEAAFAHARRAVEFGPRPSGSAALAELRAYILEQLTDCRCQVTEDHFTARTPRGEIAMTNIIARFPGPPGARAIAVTGHYDTKFFDDRVFLGASDGASSTGLLLELARALAGEPRADDVYVVFFDGEEAAAEWTEADKLYGSRHLALQWRADGTLARLKALINVDMIGDRDLTIHKEENSSPHLIELVWQTARDLGYGRYFLPTWINIDDDHMPFLQLGAPAIDLIDFDYPHWHEASDTLDKLSPRSLEVVGRVVHETVRRLERR